MQSTEFYHQHKHNGLTNGSVGAHGEVRGSWFPFWIAFFLGLGVLAGCSIFSSDALDPEIARIVVAPHTTGDSKKLVGNSAVKKFIGTLTLPVKGAIVTSHFGPRRGRFHAGMDLAAEVGTRVRAACTGTVKFAGEDVSEFGHVVVLNCSVGSEGSQEQKGSGGELVTLYAHLDEIRVATGEEVAQGDVIATVGESGNATGPHLHFETRIPLNKRFTSVDPRAFF